MRKDEKGNESRREFLKTAGKFAVYTPPALMIMSQAKANETICKSINGVIGRDNDGQAQIRECYYRVE